MPIRAVLLSTLLVCSGCTETVIRRTSALPDDGKESSLRKSTVSDQEDQGKALRVQELEVVLERAADRSEQLFRVLDARLQYLEAVAEYQSMGLAILARGEIEDKVEEQLLFSKLTVLGNRTRQKADDARIVLETVLAQTPQDSVLAQMLMDRTAHLERVSPPIVSKNEPANRSSGDAR